MRVLLIEDDVQAASYLIKGLRECGHQVELASNGDDGLHLALTEEFDVIVADRMLPQRDGLSIIRMLRVDRNFTPVLVLSALGAVNDRVAGLEAGGDDYLVKPYAFTELLARLHALTRRTHALPSDHLLQVLDLVLDLREQSVKRAGKTLRLQPREFRLLAYLMRHSGQLVTRTMLLEHVWDFHFDPQTNVIDVQISRLRAKLDRDDALPLLHTVRGAGYKLSECP